MVKFFVQSTPLLLCLFAGNALACELGAERASLCMVSVEFVQTVLAYERSEYSLKLISDVDGKSTILVSHQEDELSIVPGSGKSVELIVDNVSLKIDRYFRFQ